MRKRGPFATQLVENVNKLFAVFVIFEKIFFFFSWVLSCAYIFELGLYGLTPYIIWFPFGVWTPKFT